MRWSTLPPQDPQPWTRWFAWHPVETERGNWVWLESVERQIFFPFSHTRFGTFYSYRAATLTKERQP